MRRAVRFVRFLRVLGGGRRENGSEARSLRPALRRAEARLRALVAALALAALELAGAAHRMQIPSAAWVTGQTVEVAPSTTSPACSPVWPTASSS